MKLIRPLLLGCLLCLTCHITAQDLHWTLFTYSPLTLNPAFTGAYEGSFRVGGIARDQAPSPSYSNFAASGADGFNGNNTFLSYNFYIDAPIITGFRKQDWVGIGATFYSDKAGALSLGQNYFQGSVAYHIGLNKKQTSTFTIGFHGGSGSRSIDAQYAILASDLEINPSFNGGGTSIAGVSDQPSQHFELGAGLLFRTQANKTTGFNIGLNFKHIIPAKGYGLVQGVQEDSLFTLPLTVGLHSQLDVKMSEKWSITPAFMVQSASPALEAQVQGMLGYHLNPDKNTVLNFGLGYRFGDAAQFLLGMDIGAFRVAASFDLTLSSAGTINRNVGGFELGVSYIGRIYKDPAVKPVIFCPRF